MDPAILVTFMIIGAVAAGFGALSKGRSGLAWALFGAMLPLIAIIAIACVPAVPAAVAPTSSH